MSASTLRIITSGTVPTRSSLQAAAQRVARRVPSPATQAVREQMAALSGQWSTTLSESQRRGFVALGQIYSVTTGKTTSSGKEVFISINFARWQANMGPLYDAPFAPDKANTVGDYTLTATMVATALTLKAVSADFVGLLLVTALKPQSAGTIVMDTTKYKTLLTCDGISGGFLDVSDEYQGAFSQVAPDTRVGLCLTPITPLGFYGVSVYRDTLVMAE